MTGHIVDRRPPILPTYCVHGSVPWVSRLPADPQRSAIMRWVSVQYGVCKTLLQQNAAEFSRGGGSMLPAADYSTDSESLLNAALIFPF